MKMRLVVLISVLIAFLFLYIFSFARTKLSLPKPEDMAGREASAFMPEEIEKGKPAAKGSADLKLTGPVWTEK